MAGEGLGERLRLALLCEKDDPPAAMDADPTDGDPPADAAVVTPESSNEPIPSRSSFRQSDESLTSASPSNECLRRESGPVSVRAAESGERLDDADGLLSLGQSEIPSHVFFVRVASSAPGLPERASRAPIGSN
jgi:hypothetical protein